MVELALRTDPLDLGGQVLLWEVATAAVRRGARHQPLRPAQRGRGQGGHRPRCSTTGRTDDRDRARSPTLLDQVGPGDYVAIQAYVDPEAGVVDAIEDARTAIRDRLRVATTVGLGPRFLHSTGQLHKGGPPTGVFVQVVGDDPDDVAIPGQPFGFSTLKQAQADGDLAHPAAPRPAGRRASPSTTSLEVTR